MIIAFLGNPLLEQDSVALRVGKHIESKLKSRGCDVMFLSSAFDLFDLLASHEQVVLVDTANVKRAQLVPAEVLKKKKLFTLHDLDMASIIQLSGKKPIIIALPFNASIEEIADEVLSLLTNILSSLAQGSEQSTRSKDHRHV